MCQIYLPLVSYNTYGRPYVPEKSGLNQWNADGRLRNSLEVYIPIPISVHRQFHDFFPDRNTQFNLILPNGARLIAKVCQQGGKALMSNPNADLGQWLLRDVLNVPPCTLVTYDMLSEMNIDSVAIRKISELEFYICIAPFGSYQNQ